MRVVFTSCHVTSDWQNPIPHTFTSIFTDVTIIGTCFLCQIGSDSKWAKWEIWIRSASLQLRENVRLLTWTPCKTVPGRVCGEKLGDMSCICWVYTAYTGFRYVCSMQQCLETDSEAFNERQWKAMKGNERQMDTQNSSYLIELNRLDDRLDEFWEVNVWSSSTESENGMFLILWSWGIVIQGDDLKFPLAKIYQFQMFQMFQVFQVFRMFQFRSGF